MKCTQTVAAALLTILVPCALSAQSPGQKAAHAYREAHGPQILHSYVALLSMPNVASDSADIWRNAIYIRDRFRERGVNAELLTQPGAPPIVYGELKAPGATRTIGIYAHYDGQPVDSTRWTHAPWSPTLYTRAMEAGGEARPLPSAGEAVDPEWRLYGRSSGDDKAPIGAMLAVLDAYRAAGIRPTSNIKFFLDGEEEAGSPHMAEYLKQYRDRIDDIDIWLFCDGPVHQSGRPLVTFGVRGVTGMEVTVYGAVRPLHSGHYGNWAPVPGQMLARLLTSMKDENGKVLVAGFYDTDAPLSDAERQVLASVPAYDEQLKKELGLVRTEGEPETLAQRLMLPSLTIRGLSSGNTGPRARNVIPATAVATLGIRLVKGNDPEHMKDLVEAHIRAQGYHIVREDPDMATRLKYSKIAKVVRFRGYPAARTRMDLPIVQNVVSAVRTAAGGDLVLVPGMGGSLPLYLFTGGLGKPALIVPIANYDDNQHAANENLRIGNLWYGIDLYGALFDMGAR